MQLLQLAGIFFTMEIVGYAASFLIGLSLGLIGGGGSILTIPVLVYLFRVPPTAATSYSLVVIGTVSLFGFIGYARAKSVAYRTGLLLGLSSIATVFLTRYFILPKIPKVLFMIGGSPVLSGKVIMLSFALLMLTAAIAMIRKKDPAPVHGQPVAKHPFRLLMYGALVGLLTGVLGAGGGFLLIPVLVLFAGLPIRTATGTSLMIIALNSSFGILADLGHIQLEKGLIILITTLAIAGLAAGLYISRFIDSTKLKKGFGWFVLLMGIYILAAELIK